MLLEFKVLVNVLNVFHYCYVIVKISSLLYSLKYFYYLNYISIRLLNEFITKTMLFYPYSASYGGGASSLHNFAVNNLVSEVSVHCHYYFNGK